MHDVLTTIGVSIVVAGLLIEILGFAGIAYGPVARRLPMRSPLQLQVIGCMTFYAGCIVLGAGSLSR